MRKLFGPFIAILLLISLGNGSCHLKEKRRLEKLHLEYLRGTFNQESKLPFDSNLIISFYRSFPALKQYRKEVTEVYRQHKYTHIWYDKQGVVEFGFTLISKTRELNIEGVSSRFPYQDKVNGLAESGVKSKLSQIETEFMLTNLYLFYTEKVYKGLGDSTTTALGWLLPRKQVSYARLLDSVMTDPQMLYAGDSVLCSQYYKLRDVLKRFREIEKHGGWKMIDTDPKVASYKPGDTSKTILQIRERLFITGELKQNNESNMFDPELVEAVKKYKLHNGNNPKAIIYPQNILEMNVTVGELIKKIILNMERCRWISPEFDRGKVYIVVNIPAFKLNMFRNGKSELESPVIVGDKVTKTVIFSGLMNQIIFSPYWNVPKSIMDEEVRPGILKNKNYLKTHNMEWDKGQVRQKPGKNNSLGLVKFIVPNSDDIYMHDTPAKSLFARESRAFSHGCIRVGKPRDLAIAVLEDDPDWTPGKIDAAMHGGIEKSYSLKNKIPVYIGYFTAWVDLEGEINFYEDIYNRDDRLWQLLAAKK
ncbi:MAG: L,D-transpeptidase family protein [Bacteroidota bacterium]